MGQENGKELEMQANTLRKYVRIRLHIVWSGRGMEK